MQIIHKDVPSSFEFVLFGDNQRGNAAEHRSGLSDCIEYILDTENCFAAHMGDEVEAMWISHKFYDPEIHKDPPLKAVKEIRQQLRPLARAGKLVTILFSNHSHKLYPHYGDVTAETCEELGIPYGTFSCKIEFHFRGRNGRNAMPMKWYLTHGRRRIGSVSPDAKRNLANRLYQLQQHLYRKAGDCILMAKGHVHQVLISKPDPQLYLTSLGDRVHKRYTQPGMVAGDFIPPEMRYYVATGSFLKGQLLGTNTYTEMYELDPVDLGYVKVIVQDRRIADVVPVIL